MNTLEAAQHIHILFEDSVKELLTGLNCTVNMRPEQETEWLDAPVSVIDAGSDDLEVNIALELPMSILALTYPVPDMDVVDDENLEDWIAELANQLIGRLKTKMLAHNQEIILGLPDTTYGVEIDELVEPGPTRFSSYIDVDGQPGACHISIEFFVEDVPFVLAPIVQEDALMESDVELF